MALVAHASGTQAATVTTEHFLTSPAVAGRFRLHVDLVNMAANDVVELRVYSMVLTGGTQRVAYFTVFYGAQPTDALIVVSEAINNTLTDANAVRFSLKQTFGTGRNFPWVVYNENDGIATALGIQAKADVNAEVVDAVNVDTYAEPGQAAPPATTTLVTKIGYLFKALRNRHTQTATTFSLYNDDATTVDQKATVSDNGTTFDRGEIGSGP